MKNKMKNNADNYRLFADKIIIGGEGTPKSLSGNPSDQKCQFSNLCFFLFLCIWKMSQLKQRFDMYVHNYIENNTLIDTFHDFTLELSCNHELMVVHPICFKNANPKLSCKSSTDHKKASFECDCGKEITMVYTLWLEIKLDVMLSINMISNVYLLERIDRLEETIFKTNEKRAIELAQEALEDTETLERATKRHKTENKV